MTVNWPGTELAVSTVAVAMPFWPVAARTVPDELNAPPAPVAPGVTVNVTLTPDTGAPVLSVTVTASAVGNAWPAGVLCPSPADLAMAAGTPAPAVADEANVPYNVPNADTDGKDAMQVAMNVSGTGVPVCVWLQLGHTWVLFGSVDWQASVGASI